MELAHEIGRSDESGLHGFLRFWDGKGHTKSVVTIASKDAVQIMTVHKANGLAFKVVISLITVKNFTKLTLLFKMHFDVFIPMIGNLSHGILNLHVHY